MLCRQIRHSRRVCTFPLGRIGTIKQQILFSSLQLKDYQPWSVLFAGFWRRRRPLAAPPAVSPAPRAASSVLRQGLLSEWPGMKARRADQVRHTHTRRRVGLRCGSTVCQVSWMMPAFSDRISMMRWASASLNTMLLMVDTSAL